MTNQLSVKKEKEGFCKGMSYLDGYDKYINEITLFKQAAQAGILPTNTDVFYALGSRSFCRVEHGMLKCFEYRDNWNGWHDVAFFSIPDLVPVGTKVDADGTVGRHRTEIRL